MRYVLGLLFLFSGSMAHGEAVVHQVPHILQGEEPVYNTANWLDSDKVILQGLDKITARVFTTEVFVNQKIHFGSLEIYVRSANRTPPEDKPESVAFLEIFDNKPGQQRQKVFSGWMFSSNPALSALEHPVYDIWIKEVAHVPSADESEEDPVPDTTAEDKSEQGEEDDDADVEEDVNVTGDDADDDDADIILVDGDDDDDSGAHPED